MHACTWRDTDSELLGDILQAQSFSDSLVALSCVAIVLLIIFLCFVLAAPIQRMVGDAGIKVSGSLTQCNSLTPHQSRTGLELYSPHFTVAGMGMADWFLVAPSYFRLSAQ